MTSVEVELPIGSYSCPRAVADVFSGDTLTITSVDDGETFREFQPGQWIHAIVRGEDGYILYAHVATTQPAMALVTVPRI